MLHLRLFRSTVIVVNYLSLVLPVLFIFTGNETNIILLIFCQNRLSPTVLEQKYVCHRLLKLQFSGIYPFHDIMHNTDKSDFFSLVSSFRIINDCFAGALGQCKNASLKYL